MIQSETKELVVIETEDLSLYIKGLPYNSRFESLSRYRSHTNVEQEVMGFKWSGVDVQSVEVFDIQTGELQRAFDKSFAPIFFENGVYQLVITPKSEKELKFYHEHPGLRESVTPVGRGENPILMGNLQFVNEVGYSSFSIFHGEEPLLEITLEIFPTKLSYKDDYQKLLEEVNDEVYNLAFHFIKKTFLGATEHLSEKPSWTEFFRLIEHYFVDFTKSINQIEAQPHHQLLTEHHRVKGERIKRLDQKVRKYLRRNPQLFRENENGIQVDSKCLFPTKGLNAKKTLTFDTLENRFVKWMMERLINKLIDLHKRVSNRSGRYEGTIDTSLLIKIESMQNRLKFHLLKPFWRSISPIDRSISNMVIQRKLGYQDAYKIYLIVTRGLALQGELLKMSVKDVATLYEYWTYLKMGQILRSHYTAEQQDVVKIRHGSLFVDLDQTSNAKQVFRHPQTNERIILSFQKREGRLPTVVQKPDIMLEVEKKHSNHSFHYIFDAKYRIDFGLNTNGSNINESYNVGPLEEDINTMHRYRDALVMKIHDSNFYERFAFGAYVLFPWHDEFYYEDHPFYKSIDQVNIGGLPFLPNSISLVERLVERLVESNPEDLQEEGILPKGSFAHWQSSLDEKVLIVSVNKVESYQKFKREGYVELSTTNLKHGWQEAKYIGLYVTNEVSQHYDVENGIRYYGRIQDVKVNESSDLITLSFSLNTWKRLRNCVSPLGYGIQSHVLTNLSILKDSSELPELFLKSMEEQKLWRMLRRFSSKVKTQLDNRMVDEAHKIQAYQLGHIEVVADPETNSIQITQHENVLTSFSFDELKKSPHRVFKEIKQNVFI